MKSRMPLVTIGIPTYNRAEVLRQSIESALCQDYSNIEVIVSDNASVDDSRIICQEFSKKDDRVTCILQSSNLGASANFTEVLKRASGEYFMWLGDDDWIDVSYVSYCASILIENSDVALASGAPIYYRHGLKAYEGKVFDLLEKSWAIRVAHYYAMVADNGMFYGLMRTAQLQQIVFPNVMGGDWHLLANIVSNGKARMSPTVIIHRELGGATESYRKIAKSLGVNKIQAVLPMMTIALGAWESIVFSGAAYKTRCILTRVVLAGVVFFIIIAVKNTLGYMRAVKRLIVRGKYFISSAVNNK